MSATLDEAISAASWADLVSAARGVLAIHKPEQAVDYRHSESGRLTQVCSGCGTDSGNWQYWPCPTVRAIGIPLGVKA